MQVLKGSLKIEGLCRHVCSCEVPKIFFDIHDGPLVGPAGPWEMIETTSKEASCHTEIAYSKVYDRFQYNLIGRTFCESQADSKEHESLLLLEVAEWSSPRFELDPAAVCLILNRADWRETDEGEIYERIGRAFVPKKTVRFNAHSRCKNQTITIK